MRKAGLKTLAGIANSNKGKDMVKNYIGEMILLFKYYNSKMLETITQEDIHHSLI